MSEHTAYGHTAYGHTADGHTADGHTANGHTANGHTANGHESAAALLDRLAGLDESALVALSEQGRRSPEPPAFRGRCLAPDYLEAVASGAWTPHDETQLAQLVERAEAATLGRVRRRHRRGLRRALRMAALSVMSSNLPMTNWPDRRRSLEGPWERAVGPLPFPDRRRA